MSAAERSDNLLDNAFAELHAQKSMVRNLQAPMELAGLKRRLERARAAESSIGVLGSRYDKMLDQIEEKRDQAARHCEHLEHYNGELGKLIEDMTAQSNHPPQEAAAGLLTDGAGTKIEESK
jgi:hypothetical protein